MNKELKIEVHENEQDFKDLLRKNKTGLKLVLIFIGICLLTINGRITDIMSFSLNTKITLIIIFIVSIIAIIYGTERILVNGFKEGMGSRKELFNYTIEFKKDKIIIDRDGVNDFTYDKIKLKESKNSYFIYYPSVNKKGLVAILKKSEYSDKEKEIIEFYLKKQ